MSGSWTHISPFTTRSRDIESDSSRGSSYAPSSSSGSSVSRSYTSRGTWTPPTPQEDTRGQTSVSGSYTACPTWFPQILQDTRSQTSTFPPGPRGYSSSKYTLSSTFPPPTFPPPSGVAGNHSITLPHSNQRRESYESDAESDISIGPHDVSENYEAQPIQESAVEDEPAIDEDSAADEGSATDEEPAPDQRKVDMSYLSKVHTYILSGAHNYDDEGEYDSYVYREPQPYQEDSHGVAQWIRGFHKVVIPRLARCANAHQRITTLLRIIHNSCGVDQQEEMGWHTFFAYLHDHPEDRPDLTEEELAHEQEMRAWHYDLIPDVEHAQEVIFGGWRWPEKSTMESLTPWPIAVGPRDEIVRLIAVPPARVERSYMSCRQPLGQSVGRVNYQISAPFKRVRRCR